MTTKISDPWDLIGDLSSDDPVEEIEARWNKFAGSVRTETEFEAFRAGVTNGNDTTRDHFSKEWFLSAIGGYITALQYALEADEAKARQEAEDREREEIAQVDADLESARHMADVHLCALEGRVSDSPLSREEHQRRYNRWTAEIARLQAKLEQLASGLDPEAYQAWVSANAEGGGQ